MAVNASSILAFNRGILSKLGLARVDISRLQFAAEIQKNWMPRVLGSMMLRPGLKYIQSTDNNSQARMIPFIFARDDYAQIEVTDGTIRVLIDDVVISRGTVTAAVSNFNFTTDLTGWTDADESGATSSWETGGYLKLQGDGTNAAIRRQQVTVNEASVEHALRVVINRGPVTLRVGSSSGDDDYISETALGEGNHSLAFTPTGNFHISLSSRRKSSVRVDSCEVETSGIMEITSPWDEDDLRSIRFDQSGDVIYVACDGYALRKIERRSARSWSLVKYLPETGPFRIQNTSATTISPNGLFGDLTLTASNPIFRGGHVGALFRVASVGQKVAASITAENTFTDPIRVSGIEQGREFGILISGTFSATVTVQYSVNEPGAWVDLATTYTSAISTTYDDDQDNQVIYYRIGVKTGDFSSGPVAVTLTYSSGSISGAARITAVTNSTTATAVSLTDFGSTDASADWWEGEWSDYRGHPTAVSLYEGRLWWAGRDGMWGSISDAYEDFDDTFEGDAGPISRSIGSGPVDSIHWIMPLGRLMFGTALNSANVQPGLIQGNNILAGRSSSLDEPLTPTNFNLKSTSAKGVFVDRSGQRLYELTYSLDVNDYVPDELSLLTPDLNDDGILHLAVQMKPDVRIHCVRTNGDASVLIYDRVENVICWVEIETDGNVEDVSVLPGDSEDQVYYVVRRVINGVTKRYLEKWALESNCEGRPVSHTADSHLIYAGSETTTITGLDHLEGKTVVVWGWNTSTAFLDDDGLPVGRDMGEYNVSSGSISGLPAAVNRACVGLEYVADFKSVKVGDLNTRKKLVQLGLILLNTHNLGLKYGGTLVEADMYDLQNRERGRSVGEHHVWSSLDTDLGAMGGSWDTDSRLCLRAEAPRPCTVLAATTVWER